MKFAATILFAAAAVASVSARDCSPAEAGKAFANLAPLLSGPYLTPCATDSGYDMLNAQGLPNDAQYTKMCKLDSCKGLIKAVAASNPPDCVLVIPTSQAKMNVNELANGFDDQCKKVNPAPTTAPPTAPTTAPPTAPTTAPPTGQSTPPTTAPTTAPPTGQTTAPTTGPTKAPTPTKVAC